MTLWATKHSPYVDGQGSAQTAPRKPEIRKRPIILNPLQFALGGILLGVGLIFYYVYRKTPIALFEFIGIRPLSRPIAPDAAAYMADSLPSFIHVLSLSLIVGSLVRPGYFRYLWVCLVWLLLDASFEMAQAYGTAALTVLPEWLRDMPFLGAIDDYLRYGLFDTKDMTGIVLGACLAYGVLVVTGRRGIAEKE